MAVSAANSMTENGQESMLPSPRSATSFPRPIRDELKKWSQVRDSPDLGNLKSALFYLALP